MSNRLSSSPDEIRGSGHQLSTVFCRHSALDGFNHRIQWTYLTRKLLSTILDGSPCLSATIFVIGPFIRVLVTSPSRYVINEDDLRNRQLWIRHPRATASLRVGLQALARIGLRPHRSLSPSCRAGRRTSELLLADKQLKTVADQWTCAHIRRPEFPWCYNLNDYECRRTLENPPFVAQCSWARCQLGGTQHNRCQIWCFMIVLKRSKLAP